MKQIFQTHLRYSVLAIAFISLISLTYLTSASPHKQHVTAVQRTEAPVLFANIDILQPFAPVFEASTDLFATVIAHVQKEAKVVIITSAISPQNYPAGRVLKHYETAYIKPINYKQNIPASTRNYKAYTYFNHKNLAPLTRQSKLSLAQIQSFSC